MIARTVRPLVAAALALAACSGPEPTAADPTTPPPEPAAMPEMAHTDVASLEGVIGELLLAGHYTYVRIGDEWAVVMGSLDASPGEAIHLRVQGSQTDFHSRRLDRDFERLFFASVPKGA